MKIELGLSSLDDANSFLRALWAEFRRRFGKCGWNYQPFRNGKAQRIFIGFADIGRKEGSIQIEIGYKTKGSIQEIEFSTEAGAIDSDSDLGSEIAQAVAAAIANRASRQQHTFEMAIEGLHFSPIKYLGSRFRIQPVTSSDFVLALGVDGFDSVDAKSVCRGASQHVLDLLAVETNSAYWPREIFDGEPADDDTIPTDIYCEEADWIEACPRRDERYLISREATQVIEMIAEGQLTKDGETLLRAASHFHSARKYAAQKLDVHQAGDSQPIEGKDGWYSIPIEVRDSRLEAAGQMSAAHAEITATLYMSAIEVASLVNSPPQQTCSSCGQPQYKISQRVTQLVRRYAGEHVARIVKEYYGQRSKYLHDGRMIAASDYVGSSIPQLDPSSSSGCKVQVSGPDPSLCDFVGLCLRAVLKEIMAAH